VDVRLDTHNGTAAQVSAEHLTDSRTGTSYYTALVQVDQNELADLPNVKLYPGMPANVMFPTIERSALNYLVGPLHPVVQPGVQAEMIEQSETRRAKARFGSTA